MNKRISVKVSRWAHAVRSRAYCLHVAHIRVYWMYNVQYKYTYIHIYIYQRTSAVELTSVGLAHARPNNVFNI